MENQKRIWLEEFRIKAGLKQYEVAKAVGISNGYYSAIESGIRKTPGDIALKISILLDFPMEKFYLDLISDWLKDREKQEALPNANS